MAVQNEDAAKHPTPLWVNLVVLTAQRGLPIFAEKQTISKARRRDPKVR
jgi:hypothetical protein